MKTLAMSDMLSAILAGAVCALIALLWQKHRGTGIWALIGSAARGQEDSGPLPKGPTVPMKVGLKAGQSQGRRMPRIALLKTDPMRKPGSQEVAGNGLPSILAIALGLKAESLEGRGDFGGALAIYKCFLNSHPDSAQALNHAGYLCLRMGNPQEAARVLERAVGIDPEYASAWSHLAHARRMQRDVLGAKEGFEMALKHAPRSVPALKGLAGTFLEARNAKRACELLERVVHLKPNDPRAWNDLGTARMHSGNLVGSRKAFETALKHDPASRVAQNGLKQVGATEALLAQTARSGGTFKTAAGTVFSTRDSELVCAACSKRFTEFGQVRPDNLALGGVLCCSCKAFYCEECVRELVRRYPQRTQMSCACRKSIATFVDVGNWRFHNFEELVVFPS